MKQLPTDEELQHNYQGYSTCGSLMVRSAIEVRSIAEPIITELQQQMRLTDHLIEQRDKEMEKLRQENERLNKLLHYIPISSNVPDKKGIERDWLWLWEQIELWYGDIKRKETGSEFLKRMQRTFKLELKTKE